MSAFRICVRVRDKTTHRTWIAWPLQNEVYISAITGRKVVVYERPGYSEYNEYDEPVLDSWREPDHVHYCVAQV